MKNPVRTWVSKLSASGPIRPSPAALPLLLALFSIVTLMASRLATHNRLPILQASWYQKLNPTFSDALAVVRKHLWSNPDFFMSPSKTNGAKSPPDLLEYFSRALCYAA